MYLGCEPDARRATSFQLVRRGFPLRSEFRPGRCNRNTSGYQSLRNAIILANDISWHQCWGFQRVRSHLLEDLGEPDTPRATSLQLVHRGFPLQHSELRPNEYISIN